MFQPRLKHSIAAKLGTSRGWIAFKIDKLDQWCPSPSHLDWASVFDATFMLDLAVCKLSTNLLTVQHTAVLITT